VLSLSKHRRPCAFPLALSLSKCEQATGWHKQHPEP